MNPKPEGRGPRRRAPALAASACAEATAFSAAVLAQDATHKLVLSLAPRAGLRDAINGVRVLNAAHGAILMQAAVGTVTAVPIILLAIAANRQIVAGLTRGAVKG